jgi:hypothetical protein
VELDNAKVETNARILRPKVHPAGSVTTNLFNQPFIFLENTKKK